MFDISQVPSSADLQSGVLPDIYFNLKMYQYSSECELLDCYIDPRQSTYFIDGVYGCTSVEQRLHY
jgi:hypothetical protein